MSETHKGQVGLVGAHLGVIKWRLPKAELRVLRTDDAAHGARAGAKTDDTEDAGAAAVAHTTAPLGVRGREIVQELCLHICAIYFSIN